MATEPLGLALGLRLALGMACPRRLAMEQAALWRRHGKRSNSLHAAA